MDYTETIKSIVSKLPHKLMNFVLAEDWRQTTEKIAARFHLDEVQYVALENEVFFVLIGLRDPNYLAKNIKDELSLDLNMIGWIVEDIEKNVLLKVEDEIASLWQEEIKGSGVGASFEQLVTDQARAMRSAQAPPDNLPTGEGPRVIHNYIGDSDPYREAAE